MGIAALRKILQTTPLDAASLRGRTLAVDADNLIWQFVTAIAGASGVIPPGAHLIGLTNRLRFYADNGIRSAWVFDGPQPQLKERTLADRAARLEQPGAVAVTQKDLDECKELLGALGIPWLVAPAESDAQAAHFARSGEAWAAVTQDWDIALHGAPRAIRNLTQSKTKTPEMIDLDASLAHAKLTRDQLVDIAMLIGTDYNVGVKGVGPVKAVKLIQQHGDIHATLAAIGATIPHVDDVRALFLHHPVDATARLHFAQPDARATRDVLARAQLGEERARGIADAIARLHASG